MERRVTSLVQSHAGLRHDCASEDSSMRAAISLLLIVALASALGACSSGSGKAGDGASGASGTSPGSAGKGGAADTDTRTRAIGGTTSYPQSGSLGSAVGGAATTGGTATTGGAPTS